MTVKHQSLSGQNDCQILFTPTHSGYSFRAYDPSHTVCLGTEPEQNIILRLGHWLELGLALALGLGLGLVSGQGR